MTKSERRLEILQVIKKYSGNHKVLDRKINIIHSNFPPPSLRRQIIKYGGLDLLVENNKESLQKLSSESKHKKELYNGLVDFLDLEIIARRQKTINNIINS